MKNIWEQLLLNGLALNLNFSICLQQRDRTTPPSILRRNNFSDFTAICFCSEWSDENSQEFNLTRYSEIGWLRLKLQKKRSFTPGKIYSQKVNWKSLVNLKFPNRNNPFSRSAKFRKSNISYPLICMGACAHHGLRNVSFPGTFAYVINECYLLNDSLSKYLFKVSVSDTSPNFGDAFRLSLCTAFIRYLFWTLHF